jgi:hypothetical protein
MLRFAISRIDSLGSFRSLVSLPPTDGKPQLILSVLFLIRQYPHQFSLSILYFRVTQYYTQDVQLAASLSEASF